MKCELYRVTQTQELRLILDGHHFHNNSPLRLSIIIKLFPVYSQHLFTDIIHFTHHPLILFHLSTHSPYKLQNMMRITVHQNTLPNQASTPESYDRKLTTTTFPNFFLLPLIMHARGQEVQPSHMFVLVRGNSMLQSIFINASSGLICTAYHTRQRTSIVLYMEIV